MVGQHDPRKGAMSADFLTRCVGQAMIRCHEGLAEAEAARLVIAADRRGDADGVAIWCRVVDAIRNLRNAAPVPNPIQAADRYLAHPTC